MLKVESTQAGLEHPPDLSEALSATSIEGVLMSMPLGILIIDEEDRRDPSLLKGRMIIDDPWPKLKSGESRGPEGGEHEHGGKASSPCN